MKFVNSFELRFFIFKVWNCVQVNVFLKKSNDNFAHLLYFDYGDCFIIYFMVFFQIQMVPLDIL